jgi:hypothetical protein
VHFYFDESGDFAFARERFDCYTQAAVSCPDSFLKDLADFVGDRKRRWKLDELHAVSLTPGQRLRLCRFVAQSPLRLAAQATDTALITPRAIEPWRRQQAKLLRGNLAWYRDRGGDDPETEGWMVANAKRSELATRISDSEFLQAMFLIDLIHAALQTSLLAFHDDHWAPDFHSFQFILDGKLPDKLGAGEKFLRSALLPMLGSNARFGLDVIDAWKAREPPHPFIEAFERAGGWSGAQQRRLDDDVIDLTAIFEPGLRFERSDHHPGLQIADLLAYVVRWAMLQPDDWQAQTAYDLLRPHLRQPDGHALTLILLNTGGDPQAANRYRHLIKRT